MYRLKVCGCGESCYCVDLNKKIARKCKVLLPVTKYNNKNSVIIFCFLNFDLFEKKTTLSNLLTRVPFVMECYLPLKEQLIFS